MPPFFPFFPRLIALAVSQALLTPVQAATLTIDSNLDDDGSGCTLREAIVSLNSGTSQGGCIATGDDFGVADTINFTGLNNRTITLTQALPLSITASMSNSTIDGGDAGIVIVGDMNSGVLYLNDVHATLNNVTLTQGYALKGGGIRAHHSTVVLNNSHIIENTTSANYFGGGLYGYQSVISLTNSTVSGNSARFGGGIFGLDSSINLANSEVTGNSANRGGGIYASDILANLNNSTLSNNHSSNRGGAIDSRESTILITNSTVSENLADNRGGGIYARNSSIVSLTNSTVSDNSTVRGGGAFVSQSTLSLTNTIMAGNRATSTANEIEGYNYTGTFNFSGVNLIGDSDQTLNNAIVDVVLGSSDLSATSDGNVPTTLTNIILPLANNGGFSRDHQPATGSPVRNAADTALCTDSDQRGKPRMSDFFVPIVGNGGQVAVIDLSDTGCDIGSVEG